MKKIFLRILIAIGCIFAVLVLVVVASLWPKLSNMKSEYVTAGVIRYIGTFIERTGGQWPRSWTDLGKDYSEFTDVNFSLDPSTATKDDVLGAVKPKSGRYYTYPHSKEDLLSVYDELKKHQNPLIAPENPVAAREPVDADFPLKSAGNEGLREVQGREEGN
jgi:hypothetical protein